MLHSGIGIGLIGQRILIQIVLEDGLDTAVAGTADAQCPSAGSFQSCIAKVFGQPQDAQTASKALLGMGTRVEDRLDQGLCVGSDFARPADEAIRSPLRPLLMGFGHVFFDGGVPALLIAADVAGHALVFVEAFDGGLCDAHIDFVFGQLIGHTVVMALHFNVIVDIDGGFFPLGILLGFCGQRIERRPIQSVKQLFSAAGQLLKRFAIELN